MKDDAAPKTAFVLAGGGSFGAVQVGMLRELLARGVTPDLIVVIGGRDQHGLRRQDVFPVGLRSLVGLVGGQSTASPARCGLMKTEAPPVEYPGLQAVRVISARQGRR